MWPAYAFKRIDLPKQNNTQLKILNVKVVLFPWPFSWKCIFYSTFVCPSIAMRYVLACLHLNRLTMIGEVRLTSAGRGVRAAVHLGRVRWTAIHFAVTELDVASDCIGYHWRVCRVLGCLKSIKFWLQFQVLA